MANEPATEPAIRILENAQHILAALYEDHDDALHTARLALTNKLEWMLTLTHKPVWTGQFQSTPDDRFAFWLQLARSSTKPSSLEQLSPEDKEKIKDLSFILLPGVPPQDTARNGIHTFLSVLDINKPTGRIPPEYEGDFHQLAEGCRSPDASERITGWKARILLHHLGQSGEPSHVFQEDLVNTVLEEHDLHVLLTLSKFDPGPDASGFRQSLANAWEKRTGDNNLLIGEAARQAHFQLVWGQDMTGQSSLRHGLPPANRTAMGR